MNEQKILLWPIGAVAAAALFLASAIAVLLPAQAGAASPMVTYTGSAMPFATIQISGSGFGANEPIHVMLSNAFYDTNTDAAGAFGPVPLTIPNVQAGTNLIIAIGQHTGLVAFNYIYIGGFYPQAQPSSWYAAPGSTLTWSGSGFAPGEAVTVTQGTTQLAQFAADNSGSFVGQAGSMVPYSAHGGSLSYTVHGLTSGATIPITIGVSNLYPWVNPSAWYIIPGSLVTFSGGGFGAGEGISVYLGTSTQAVAHITADSSGNFVGQGQVTIPFGSGAAPYRLVGDQSGAQADAPITRALFYPWLTPSAYYSAPGGMLTVGGQGFAPDEDVVLTSGGTTLGTGHTNNLGTFSALSVHMPANPNTVAQIVGTGAKSGATAQVGIAIGSYYTWMTLSSWWAMGGSPLTITGHNFAAGETVAASSGAQSLGSGTANNSGDVTIVGTVPHGTPGSATITLTGQTSGAPASVTMTIAPVWTSFEVPPYYGAPLSAVHLVGHGYQPGEAVDITTNNTTGTQATVHADSSGNFDDSSWHVPAGVVNTDLMITATGEWTGDTKTVDYYVTGM